MLQTGDKGRPQRAAVSCADVVLALESMPHGGLSAAALHDALCCEADPEHGHRHAMGSER